MFRNVEGKYILGAELVGGIVNCSVRATTNLVVDGILVYTVLCLAIDLVTEEGDVGIKCLLAVRTHVNHGHLLMRAQVA